MKKTQIISVLIIFIVVIFISATTTYFIQAYRYQRFQEVKLNFYDDIDILTDNMEVNNDSSSKSDGKYKVESDISEFSSNEYDILNSEDEDMIDSPRENIDDEAIMPENDGNEFVERVKRQAKEYSNIFYLQGGFQPRVAISFDDGPSPHHTSDILEILNYYNVPATFFVLGSQAEYHPEILRDIHNGGHEVANHSYSHINFAEISLNQVVKEIEMTNDIIERQTGYKPEVIRPPYGSISNSQLDYFRDKNYNFVNWSLDTMDWNEEVNDPDIMMERVKRLLHPGAIILLHDGGGDRTNTAKLLPSLIEYIEEFGYELVTVSELLQDN